MVAISILVLIMVITLVTIFVAGISIIKEDELEHNNVVKALKQAV